MSLSVRALMILGWILVTAAIVAFPKLAKQHLSVPHADLPLVRKRATRRSEPTRARSPVLGSCSQERPRDWIVHSRLPLGKRRYFSACAGRRPHARPVTVSAVPP